MVAAARGRGYKQKIVVGKGCVSDDRREEN